MYLPQSKQAGAERVELLRIDIVVMSLEIVAQMLNPRTGVMKQSRVRLLSISILDLHLQNCREQ